MVSFRQQRSDGICWVAEDEKWEDKLNCERQQQKRPRHKRTHPKQNGSSGKNPMRLAISRRMQCEMRWLDLWQTIQCIFYWPFQQRWNAMPLQFALRAVTLRMLWKISNKANGIVAYNFISTSCARAKLSAIIFLTCKCLWVVSCECQLGANCVLCSIRSVCVNCESPNDFSDIH